MLVNKYILPINSGSYDYLVIGKNIAKELGLKAQDRIMLQNPKHPDQQTLCFAEINEGNLKKNSIGIPLRTYEKVKKGLNLNAQFSAYKNKIYKGKIESVASRVDAQTRSILARAKIDNENLEIIPGSLLEIEILYNQKNTLGIPDTSIIYEGNKKFIYKIIENNMLTKVEIKTGVRNQGNLEILDGLVEGDKIIAEGLTKVRPGMKIKPIIK